MVAYLRGLFFAILRFALACLLVATPIAGLMFVGDLFDPYFSLPIRVARFATMIGLGALILGLALPVMLAYPIIAQKRPPYFKRGYWLVVAYGPLLILGMDHKNLSTLIGFGVPYELVALAVFAAYVWLWKIGDKLAARFTRARPVTAERYGT